MVAALTFSLFPSTLHLGDRDPETHPEPLNILAVRVEEYEGRPGVGGLGLEDPWPYLAAESQRGIDLRLPTVRKIENLQDRGLRAE